MFYSWISFWLTYFIGGCFFYNDKYVKIMPNSIITFQNLMHTLGINALITFAFIPIANAIPSIIIYPNTLIGYLFRVMTATFIGDICFYWSHRLFHHRLFYFLHKKHHEYIIPHSLAGLYCSPAEMLITNHLSIVLALKLVSIHSPVMLIIESSVIALNILKSHSGIPDYIQGSPHHALHHDKMNCNYGFSYITDIIFDTYQS